MITRYFPALGIALVVSLVGCATPAPQPSPTAIPPAAGSPAATQSRYAIEQDVAPLRPISPEEVVDAVPRPDPLLAIGNVTPYIVDGESYEVLEDYRSYREQGIASWYGAKFTGYETSNGELYDLYLATAAHKSLPIPSYARVTNLENGQSVVVRVNDRGPFHSDRIMDLSYAAAVKLGYMEKGTAPVEVEVLDVAGVKDLRDVPYAGYRFLQMGAFGKEAAARSLMQELQVLLAAPVFVSPIDAGGTRLYRVRIGPIDEPALLLALQQQLQDNGYAAGQPLP